MIYINNQYIRLDIPLDEIAKIKIKIDKNNKMISDLEIEDEPNIIIATEIDKKIDYCNIYSSVRILITNYALIGKIEEIPDFIEVVIVDNKIYYNRNEKESDKEFDLLLFEDNKDIFEIKVERLIEKGKINSSNKVGDTILNYLILNKKEEKALELIDKMDMETINKVNKYYNETALIIACCNKMESIALKLLERKDININQVNNLKNTALKWACINKMETVALKLLERKDINVNHIDNNGNTALMFACIYKMESIALKLLEREDININQVNRYGYNSALDIAINDNIESVINRINELNKK